MDNKNTTEIVDKPFYQSKIVWIAVATMFLGALDQFSVIGQSLPTEYQGIFTMAIGGLTLLARAFSASNITLKK